MFLITLIPAFLDVHGMLIQICNLNVNCIGFIILVNRSNKTSQITNKTFELSEANPKKAIVWDKVLTCWFSAFYLFLFYSEILCFNTPLRQILNY